MKGYVFNMLFGAIVADGCHFTAAQVNIPKLVWYTEPMPELLSGGGRAGIMAAVYQRFIFPAECLRAQVEGRAFVAFTITPAGEVRQVEVIKALYEPFDAAAVRAVQQLPCFRPRPTWRGSVRYVVGVGFREEADYADRR